VANRRAKLPLDPTAVVAANQQLWAKYPELKGRQLTMSSADTKCRKFWMDAYLASANDPAPTEGPHCLAAPCQTPEKPGCGKSAEEYQQKAEDLVSHPGASTLDRNKAITKAYADIYKSNPMTYKWAGMAAFASCEVGKGMQEAQEAQSGWKHVGGVLAGVDGKKLESALKSGNDAVYADIYWQLLAYQGCGIEDLQKAYDESKINDDVLEAWQKIDHGKKTGDEDLIWEGNKSLLKFEQRQVLQSQVYDKDPMLWLNASIPPASLYKQIDSPIPGDKTSFQNYYFFSHSIGDFDSRWEWIEKSMLPKWMELDKTGVDNVSEKLAPCLK
jgi:hypothetical protein